MPSFDAVNYSLRPSKSIERQIVFDAVSMLRTELDVDNMLYIGLGSIWFTDFLMAHRLFKIEDMISIEAHDVGYQRATYNCPYATVSVRHGMSSEVLPTLLEDDDLKARRWFVWLDYDSPLNEAIRDDLQLLVENAPPNSILITTFNGHPMAFGRPVDRIERLQAILGDAVPDGLEKRDVKEERMQQTLATSTMRFMQSVAASMSRPGGFLPAFRVVYQDNAPMVTVGGVLPDQDKRAVVKEIIESDQWTAAPEKPIRAPHLTMKEAAVLQSQLPDAGGITRAKVQELGFDLEDDQIEAFTTYYRQYPSFAQIIS